MSRFSRYDTDDERLPEGMTRVGYDADTQVYTFQDSDGSLWESAPGNQYGQLTRVSGGAPDDDDTAPFLESDQQSYSRPSWRAELMPLLNFGVLVGLCLLALFWYLHVAAAPSGEPSSDKSAPKITCADDAEAYSVTKGDSCWSIADGRGVSVDDIEQLNEGLDCQILRLGSYICVPQTVNPV
jgi:hypothetical protein